MKIIISLIFCSALFFVNESNATFNDAVKNYEAGKYEEALAEFKSLAEIGNKGAQYNLGFMYVDGLGVKQDLVKGYAWIKLSDEKGNSEEKQGVLKQIESYFKDEKLAQVNSFYEELVMQYGEKTIQTDLMPIFDIAANGASKFVAVPIKTTPANYPYMANVKGIEGFVSVEFYLDSKGQPVELNITESYPPQVFDREVIRAISKWKFEIPQEKLESPLRYRMEFALDEGGYSKKAIDTIKNIQGKAENGDAVSQYYFAKYGPSILRGDSINATEWYYKAAQQGIADAQHEVALNLLNGQGCMVDIEKGLKWLTKAASANLGRSQLKLSKWYSKANTADSLEKSQFWFDKAVEANDKEIAIELARMILATKRAPKLAINQLKLLDEDGESNELDYNQLFASSYAELGNYKQAIKYQKRANKIMRGYGKVPKEMQDKLTSYKELLKKS